MEQGPSEQMVLEGCYKRGLPIPDTIRDAPELMQGLSIYYDAFLDLGTCRNMGSMVPWTAMKEYAEWLELEGEDFDRFIFLMKELDAEWWEVKNKKEPGKTDGGPE